MSVCVLDSLFGSNSSTFWNCVFYSLIYCTKVAVLFVFILEYASFRSPRPTKYTFIWLSFALFFQRISVSLHFTSFSLAAYMIFTALHFTVSVCVCISLFSTLDCAPFSFSFHFYFCMHNCICVSLFVCVWMWLGIHLFYLTVITTSTAAAVATAAAAVSCCLLQSMRLSQSHIYIVFQCLHIIIVIII